MSPGIFYINFREMNLYFIAVEPQREIADKIRAVSKDFADRFESVKAYKNFPHITIIPVFKLPEEKEELLLNNFSSIKLETPAFELQLNGFQAFQNKKNPVIYIHPENKEQLKQLFNELSVFFNASSGKSFHPHVTVAYRDLTLQNFELAWSEYEHKPFRESFTVHKTGLYKYINNRWVLQREINLPAETV